MAAVYAPTTGEFIIWGGANGAFSYFADGAAYDPKKGTWRTMAPAPLTVRTQPLWAWTGTRLVVYGGDCVGYSCEVAAAYDPATDTWSSPSGPVPINTETHLNCGVAVSGRAAFYGGVWFDGGNIYDPQQGRIDAIPSPGSALPSAARVDYSGWSDGESLFVWGGSGQGGGAYADGASFSLATGTWSSLPAAGMSARTGAPAVWTGREAIVWGGFTDANSWIGLADGKIYRP
jgi:hypothetical protein